MRREEIAKTAFQAAHVLVLVGGRVPELVLGGLSASQPLICTRPLEYSTDHILPVSLSYAFIRSLPSGLQRANLERILPLDGSATSGTKPKQSRFDAQSAGLVSNYVRKVRGSYFNSVHVVSRAMATAATDPEVQRLFTASCRDRRANVAAWAAHTTGWTGPPLALVTIGQDSQPTNEDNPQIGGECRDWCLLSNEASETAVDEVQTSTSPSSIDLGQVSLK
ncbi:MAG: hypothetical protein M1838_004075 [Thelocarpon superellum]|nr:MAG: hypothetical protein M1838_004075 [Thelocarpon superellum]